MLAPAAEAVPGGMGSRPR